MEIINLTPHNLNLIKGEEVISIPSSGIARCEETTETVNIVGGIEVERHNYGQVVGLPEPKADTIYVVSMLVLKALNGAREDVFAVGETVRDPETKAIIGFKKLSVL